MDAADQVEDCQPVKFPASACSYKTSYFAAEARAWLCGSGERPCSWERPCSLQSNRIYDVNPVESSWRNLFLDLDLQCEVYWSRVSPRHNLGSSYFPQYADEDAYMILIASGSFELLAGLCLHLCIFETGRVCLVST
jgi:hypothetical protein